MVTGAEALAGNSGMQRPRLERANQRQVKWFLPRKKIRRRDRLFDARQPRGSALLQRLDGDLLPFDGFGGSVRRVKPRGDAF